MGTTKSTLISVGEGEKRVVVYNPQEENVIVEGREADDAYKKRAWVPGEAAEGRTPAHQLPYYPMPRSTMERGDARVPGVTTPMVTSA